MFEKILIANRGEIACRVIRTARAMGIETVAVYSEADETALHVEMADEAVAIGPPPAAESYLSGERIIKAAADTGAQAIHPGYGFLSENPVFAEAVERAGLTFIGPGAKAIAAMGDKIESKKIAQGAGVSTIPGFLGTVPTADEAVEIARGIGYPVMIKAAAGGGGKGMRIAHGGDEVRSGFERAVSEAMSAFGDGRVFIEKFIERPRHIEIQVLADSRGNVIHLGERECSIQRRHQKVIEEAPSPFLDSATRTAMCEQAVALARAVGYRSAGTVEFIVDSGHNFFFLEMNARLQVEHAVTEMITGLDLVEQMIRIAAGEPLSIKQEDVRFNGWAIESRLYAEDPARGFLPSAGSIVRYRAPPQDDHVRVDSGVTEGDEIGLFYDPLMAKLITHGETRGEAIRRHGAALDAYYIRGFRHNANFLAQVMANERFRAGEIDTDFIATEWPDGAAPTAPGEDARPHFVAVAALIHSRQGRHGRTQARGGGASGQGGAGPGSSKEGGAAQGEFEWVAMIGGEQVPFTAVDNDGGFDVVQGGATVAVRGAWTPGGHLFEGTINGEPKIMQVDRLAEGYRLTMGGHQADVVVRHPRAAELAKLMPDKPEPDSSRFLQSPMPGLVLAINVCEGESVEAGHTLAVVDAMKMENVLAAERKARIAKILVAPGDSLTVDQVIMEFE
ncbi:MAG: acetyl/propionyl/methylcrotonyl-CoA carboxylase subunit alpha [Proteobacteria bacterium]|nr:acetyl/propionyl/methylcrotonyl-CoA carboxylase subunit alpha [Pseudomonadota bacterium]